jgi:hypothetical protein
MARFSTLFLALLIASPALYAGFVTHQLDAQTALLRLLIAVPVAAIMLGLFRMITRNYGRTEQDEKKKPVSDGAGPTADEPLKADAVPASPSSSAVPRTDPQMSFDERLRSPYWAATGFHAPRKRPLDSLAFFDCRCASS